MRIDSAMLFIFLGMVATWNLRVNLATELDITKSLKKKNILKKETRIHTSSALYFLYNDDF